MQDEVGQQIRMSAVLGDLAPLAEVSARPEVRQHLQSAGEALLAVREQLAGRDLERADGVAERLGALLLDRDWPGDTELAALLRPGQNADEPRRLIRADLDQLADLLEGSPDDSLGGVLDMQTGVAWPDELLEDWSVEDPCPDPDENPERYLYIPREGSRDAWRDMRDFSVSLTDEAVRDELLDAIDGKGAFSRFRRALERHDGLWTVWRTYSTEARVGRARAWLHDAGYAVLPPAPGS